MNKLNLQSVLGKMRIEPCISVQNIADSIIHRKDRETLL